MTSPAPLQRGQVYHIYNRGNNPEEIFIQERNYRHFLQLYAQYVEPVADTYAYCLLRNHFHFLVRINDEDETLRVSRRSPSGDKTLRVSKPLNKSAVRKPVQRLRQSHQQGLPTHRQPFPEPVRPRPCHLRLVPSPAGRLHPSEPSETRLRRRLSRLALLLLPRTPVPGGDPPQTGGGAGLVRRPGCLSGVS